MIRRSALTWLALALCGCSPPGATPRPGCPVALVDSEWIRDGLLRRQRLRVQGEGREIALDVVVQSHDGQLTIVGFTPFGTRAFAIRQRGREPVIDDFAGRRMGVPPLWVLDALHRSYFIAAPSLLRAATVQRWNWGDEAVVQTSDGEGEPLRRSFRRARGGAGGSDDEVTVEYSRSHGARALVRNPWCGYEIRIETLSEESSQ